MLNLGKNYKDKIFRLYYYYNSKITDNKSKRQNKHSTLSIELITNATEIV
jgi:hypothetical protein